jgi:hypothetical protein
MPRIRVETKIHVSDVIKAEKRDIYFVAVGSILKADEKQALGCWVTPLGMLIVEKEEQYAISIKGERMPLEEILKLAPSLMKVINKKPYL